MKMLIIEDDLEEQKLMRDYLGKAGYGDIVFASTGAEGLAIAGKGSFDVILIDTLLPDMNGFDVCRQLRDVVHVYSKIIVMTGAIDAVDAMQAKRMGADDYCVKTSDYISLCDVIKHCCAT